MQSRPTRITLMLSCTSLYLLEYECLVWCRNQYSGLARICCCNMRISHDVAGTFIFIMAALKTANR